MSEVSFTSAIRPVSSKQFNKFTADIVNNVNEWRAECAKKGLSAKTDRILDCTALGITDGQNVFLMHIIPEIGSNKHFFAKIIDKIKENIDMSNEYLQALLVGSKNYSKESRMGYNNFAHFLKENKIPFSELKGGDNAHKIAYHSKTDEWLVSNPDIDSLIQSGETNPKKLLDIGFDTVRINKLDELV